MKTFHSSRRPWPAAGVLILTGLVLLGACQQEPGEDTGAVTPESGAAREQPEHRFKDYHQIETQAGVVQWILDSDEMLKYAGRRDVELVGVKMDFFRDGTYYSTLVSDSGTANPTSNDVFVWGHVVITNTDGRRLRTSELRYTSEDGRIRNQVYSVFDQEEDILTGIGLEATPDLTYFVFTQDIAAVIPDLTYFVFTQDIAAEIGDEIEEDGAGDNEAAGERP